MLQNPVLQHFPTNWHYLRPVNEAQTLQGHSKLSRCMRQSTTTAVQCKKYRDA